MKYLQSIFLSVILLAITTTILSARTPKNQSPKNYPYLVEEVFADGKANNVSEKNNLTKPKEILGNMAIASMEDDNIHYFPDPKLGIGSKFTIYRAPVYRVTDGKKELELRSWSKTVGALLNEEKIELGMDDKINFSPKTKLELGMAITIIRVAKTTIKETESIDYKVVTKKDPDLEKGRTRVEQVGETGVKNLFYEVTREDGVEVSRKLQKAEIAKDPIAKIVYEGTKIVSYGTGVASWYIDSSLMIGAVNIVPKGTRVRVVNLANGKEVVVTAAGGGLRGDRIIDLSTAAFRALGASTDQGLIKGVRLEKIYE